MPDPRERRGDEHTSRTHDNAGRKPEKEEQSAGQHIRDVESGISPPTPDKAEGEREEEY
jgi:hypothetical protein